MCKTGYYYKMKPIYDTAFEQFQELRSEGISVRKALMWLAHHDWVEPGVESMERARTAFRGRERSARERRRRRPVKRKYESAYEPFKTQVLSGASYAAAADSLVDLGLIQPEDRQKARATLSARLKKEWAREDEMGEESS